MSEALQKVADRIVGAKDVDKSDVSALMALVDTDPKKAQEFAGSLRSRSYNLVHKADLLGLVARAIEAHAALYGQDVPF
jgi:hypothetical protein